MAKRTSSSVSQRSILPRVDLREMMRQHIVDRGLAYMEQAQERRQLAQRGPAVAAAYRQQVAATLREYYADLPAGPHLPPPPVSPVSTFEQGEYRVENVVFESWPGWKINASVFVPSGTGPFPAVVFPCGHGPKTQETHQLPPAYFAKAGYIAVTFDSPMFGEKGEGNDHFRDGVRHYLIGRTSSRFFVADALRCIDYLETRTDADLSRGVAMTGVSGGGTTTLLCGALDDRVAVIGPSCCVTPAADLDIVQCYAGCPETHQFGRYAMGLDETDLLCASSPKPCLLMAGTLDTVFHIEDTRKLAEVAAAYYASEEAGDRFSFFADEAPHSYSLRQAREMARFLNRWLRGEPDRALPRGADKDVAPLADKELCCHSHSESHMRSLAISEADTLAGNRDRRPDIIRQAAAKVTGVTGEVALPESEIGPAFQVIAHDWHALMLRPEEGIELPATWLRLRGGTLFPAILHVDDRGRHRLLYKQELLTSAMGFIIGGESAAHLLTVDLRGWGDSVPGMYPYEMASWGGVDRYLAYASAALGDGIMAMRIRDALSSLAWLRSRPEVDGKRIIVTGCGAGSVVALHAAAIDGRVAGVVTWHGLSSFRHLLGEANYTCSADLFMPNVLRHYDLPDLAGSLPCPVHVCGMVDGSGQPAGDGELKLYRVLPNVQIDTEASSPQVAECIREMIASTAGG
ncbi:MAG: acetylxylan esterase [Phycisphaeraceae bacterium]|nr:acetylxylan esterase [Phycisphaeraceae bacterium]